MFIATAALGAALAGAAPASSALPARPAPASAPPAPPALPATPIAAFVERAVGAAPGELRRLYMARGWAPLWLDAAGRPTRQARDALALLADAAADGLDPRDYRGAELSAVAATLEAAAIGADAGGAFDIALSRAVLRLLRELHAGRVDPRSIGFRVPPRSHEHDWAAVLGAALAADRLAVIAQEARPTLQQYGALRALLLRWRAIAADPAATVPLPALPPKARSVKPDQAWAGVGALRQRLVAIGDLAPPPAAPDDALYGGALVNAVKRFQARHGLDADGAIGRTTHAALAVAPAQRVRQIELGLERLRWLPHADGRRFVAINIPMFRLWAVEAADAAAPPVAMNVIVGRALDTQTPILFDEMSHVVFRPYWNVPRSIVRNEVLPALARDASYLARHDMEIVAGPGDDARAVAPAAEAIDALRDGRLRLRQRPGPKNSLGLVKFVFPNDDAVYMHGTPAQQLFGRARRDFSHGCVRLEDPVALAQWVLREQPEWTRERIVDAMNGTRTLQVDLKQPLPVILYYTTVLATADGGAMFADDIYRHDARLERALAGRPLTD